VTSDSATLTVSDQATTNGLPYTAPSFKCSNTTKTWTSAAINITGASSLKITANAKSYESDKMEDADYLKISYRINGGSWGSVLDHKNDLGTKTINFAVPGTGNTLEIMIQAKTSDTNETYEVNNLVVSGTNN